MNENFTDIFFNGEQTGSQNCNDDQCRTLLSGSLKNGKLRKKKALCDAV